MRIRLTPRSSRDEVLGLEDGVYRVKVKAPPVEGRANKALIAFLSKVLRVPKSGIEIKAGERSREKTVLIEGLSEAEVGERLGGTSNIEHPTSNIE